MGEYYDKEKFTGGRPSGGGPRNSQTPPPGGYPPPPNRGPYQTPPPRRPYQTPPPVQKKNNSGWYSWPVIIILFAVGAWPIALALLFLNIFSDGKRGGKTAGTPAGTRTAAGYDAQARSAVERAIHKAEAKADRAGGKVDQAFDRAGESVDQAVERALAQMERTIDRAARQVERAGKSPRQAAPPPPKAKPAKEAKEKKPKTKPAGVMLRILGAVALFVGFCIAGDIMSEALRGYGVDFDDFFASLGFLGAGGLMFFRGRYLNKMSRRSQRYILAIGNTDAMPIDEIAKRVNRKPAQAEKELQKLIDKGYLGEDAYIDHERGYFLRFGATLEEEPVPEPRRQEEPAAAPQPAAEAVEKGYSGILRSIRRANDRIADPELSRKIDRIEQVITGRGGGRNKRTDSLP